MMERNCGGEGELSLDWRFILGQVWNGRNMGRTLMHMNVRADVKAMGTVLDAGAGRGPSYLPYVDLDADDMIAVDLSFRSYTGTQRRVSASVTHMPFRSGSIDTVLCFNLLEHVFDFRQALSEISRIMKPGGVMYGWIPLIHEVHGAPYDFWRFTDNAMARLLIDAGFTPAVTHHGSTFTAIFDMLAPYCKLGPLKRPVHVLLAGLALLATSTVEWVAKRRGSSRPWDCPNGLWFVAVKRLPPTFTTPDSKNEHPQA